MSWLMEQIAIEGSVIRSRCPSDGEIHRVRSRWIRQSEVQKDQTRSEWIRQGEI